MLTTHNYIYNTLCAACSLISALLLLLPRTTISVALGLLLCSVSIFSLLRIYQNQSSQQQRTLRYQRLGRKLVRSKRLKRRDEQHALKILDHIVQCSNDKTHQLQIWQRPLQIFSGDLAISCRSNSGDSYTLLADLTGHGIAAAMGATPVSSIFQTTAKHGMAVEDIIYELNNKLTDLLPSGFFCCAAVVKTERNKITVCNAGLPEILVAANDGTITDRIISTQLPLGIQKLERQDVAVYTKTYQNPHQLYTFTDGLIESPGLHNQSFDLEQLEKTITSQTNGESRLPAIQQCFDAFAKGTQANDDISIVEVKIC